MKAAERSHHHHLVVLRVLAFSFVACGSFALHPQWKTIAYALLIIHLNTCQFLNRFIFGCSPSYDANLLIPLLICRVGWVDE